MSPYTPPRPAYPRLKRVLRAWGRRHLLRAALYAAVLLLCVLPLVQVYRDSMAFARTPLAGYFGASGSTGPLIWFRLENDELIPADAREPGAIGISFDSMEARWAPSPAGLAMREIVVSAYYAEWDDATLEPPDLDDLARMLAEASWGESPTGFVSTIEAPGVCRLRWFDRRAARLSSIAAALSAAPGPAIPLGILIVMGEVVAVFGRRMPPDEPGLCRSCGYPLQDVPGPFCPECGVVRGYESRS